MNFDLNKAQKLLQQSARDFFARECKPERVRELMATDTAFDDGLWRAMADQGWTGLIIPEEFGGLGLSLVDLIAVSEEMGRACLPGPFLSTLWAAALIDRAGGEGQRKQYLEPIAAGDMKATVALLEEDADWNPESVQLRAEKEGKEFRLRGRKEFVTDAEVADLIICVARGNDGLVLAPVEKGAKGMKIAATPGVDSTRKLYSVEFEDVVAPEADALAFNTRTLDAVESATATAVVALCRDAGRDAVDAGKRRRIRQDAAAVRQTNRRLSSRAASARRHVPDDRRRAFGGLLRRLGRLGERPVCETGSLGRQGLLLRRRARSRQPRRPGPRRHRIHLGTQPAALLQTSKSV